MKRKRRPCTCRHGYGTHELVNFEDTVIPGPCNGAGCPCVRYVRDDRSREQREAAAAGGR